MHAITENSVERQSFSPLINIDIVGFEAADQVFLELADFGAIVVEVTP